MKKTCSLLVLAMALVTITFYSCKNEGSGGGTSSFNEKSKPATDTAIKWHWHGSTCCATRCVFSALVLLPLHGASGYLGVGMYQSVVHGIPVHIRW
jgi:hypothetical protein